MKIYLTLRLFLCVLILREACPKNAEEKVAMSDHYLLSEEYIVKMNRAPSRGPYFDTSATKNVTSLVGKTGHLNCRIKNLGNKTVSWIRHRDLHLLTVSESTYTSDQRFTSIYNKQTGDWSLQIKFPQLRDSGIYECQVSTTPPVGYTMIFSVVEPITSIPGGPEIYIDLGSTVNLTCVIKHLPDPPIAVHWTHKNQDELTKEQTALLRNAFNAFDPEKNGYINTAMVGTILSMLGHQLDDATLADIIAEVDEDGSGQIEFEEFTTLAARFLVEEDAEAMMAELKEAFRLYDKEGNGYITTGVLREILRELDDKLTNDDLDMMIEEIDSDGSGTVDFDEFMEVMTGGDD